MAEPQASICRESTTDEKQFEGATLWFDRRRRLKMFDRLFFFFYSNRTFRLAYADAQVPYDPAGHDSD